MQIISLLQDPTLPQKAILEKLICHSINQEKSWLLTHTEYELSDDQVSWIIQSYHQYTQEKKPLEYMLGYVTFLGVQFQVSPATLIPRPETEYMIQAINEHIQTDGQSWQIVDIGTGCGVLGLSVLYHNPQLVSKLMLTDISDDALEVAKKNSDKLFGMLPHLGEESPQEEGFIDTSVQLESQAETAYVDETYLKEHNLIAYGHYLPYNPDLKERARELRKNMTPNEKKLWLEYFKADSQFLRKSPLTPLNKGGNSEHSEEWGDLPYRVLRQRVIDNYIVDFYIPAAKLVIEIDGDTHDSDDSEGYDQARTDILEGYGLTVMRFSNQEIQNNFDKVCNEITNRIRQATVLPHLGEEPPQEETPITLLQSDLLNHPDIHTFLLQGTTILVANLPYIPEQMFEDNVADNVKKREPKIAFVGGDDGLDRYRKMFDQVSTILLPVTNKVKQGADPIKQRKNFTMYLEMMTRQIDILRQEYGDKLLFEEVKTFHFNIRIVKAMLA